MILAAPPAAAITYVNESSGLEPSVYGGGGSPSSTPFPDGSPFVSFGSAALVSATAVDAAEGPKGGAVSSNGGAGAKAAIDAQDASVTEALMRLSSASGGK